ncbi:MAG: tRNA 2-thiocytidine biosynthesis protein TtcA [Syntrophothermus sp.]|uniref:tRNA 2-thiocytidine biosynthesis TtcA family protein n=1 Tax=Syntrophothermus sp. TaxID=2736299 RepID=UPI00257B16D8|nr:tRNA 2-thiocytidine biosynthesis TtcA family protein [Syntrophothermus sp.]NSW83044.1 tRNA 2-thiocytidine biosynthesis protein TtcA [Syntrophothermus sp.]
MARLEKELFHKVKRANLKYQMIGNGDRVALGLSGGKDSLALLHALIQLRRYTPLQFDIIAITVDLGFGSDHNGLKQHCRELNVPLIVEPTNIGRIVFEERKENSPCSLCSNLRKGALHRVALAENCNKVALAHHLDDAVVTFFMSMAYEGQARCFKPSSFLDRTGLTLVRPLVYVPENLIIRLCKKLNLPVESNPCPAAGQTKRALIQKWLAVLDNHHPQAKLHFLTAIEKLYWQ